jgi:hypothetical protein
MHFCEVMERFGGGVEAEEFLADGVWLAVDLIHVQRVKILLLWGKDGEKDREKGSRSRTSVCR